MARWFAAALLLWTVTAGAEDSGTLAECRAIAGDDERLACYDDLAGRAAPAPEAEAAGTGLTEDNYVPPRLRQEQRNATNRFVIIPYHRNYLLPVTYNSNPNKEAWKEAFPGTNMDKFEAKFQISFKAIMWQDIFGPGTDLWGAYTQTNWMQAYNTDASSPFRETDYEPELILSIDNDWRVLGFRNTRLEFSFNHQSNGQSDPESRSWNRLIGSALFERKNFSLKASAWYRLPESDSDDDNPNIDDYMGNGELQGLWRWDDYSLGFVLRNNLEHDNKGAIQIDWTFPLSQRFQGYVQYFNGYGESLIDYNESSNRIGIGVSLTDPF